MTARAGRRYSGDKKSYRRDRVVTFFILALFLVTQFLVTKERRRFVEVADTATVLTRATGRPASASQSRCDTSSIGTTLSPCSCDGGDAPPKGKIAPTGKWLGVAVASLIAATWGGGASTVRLLRAESLSRLRFSEYCIFEYVHCAGKASDIE